ncbi:ABC transporter substrate-binding protein [Microbacterium sp. PA5]|uniref:ABC transporter substrate-binding protein n=1 Tax=Microbacterium sp. PA5 TaxID=3416654 RepID=UPI003CEF600B
MRLSRTLTRLTAVAAAVVLAAGMTACGPTDGTAAPGDDEPRVLRVGTSAALTSLDPARSAAFGVAFLTPVYETLILRDAEGLLEPGLATEWTLNDDATQLELTLREGVEFQDGEVFDAEAVKANIEAAADRGGQIATQLSVVTQVDVVDDHALTLTMSRPAADILGVLASEAGMMISPAALGADDIETNPVGTGPFTVVEQNQSGISYEAWDGYWNAERIKLDRIEILTGLDDDQVRLNAVLTDEVQVAQTRYSAIEEQEQRAPDTVVSLTGNRATVVGIMLNTAEGEWANPAMRLAAQHAIDRQGISDALYDGGCEPVAQPYPTSYWASDPALESSDDAAYDPDLARELLSDAGLTGTPVTLYVGAATLYQNMAAAVQQQLNDVGMDVTVESFDTATLADLRASGSFEASIALVNSARPDPAQFVQQFYASDGVFNYGKYAYEGIDEPLAAMNSTADQEQRAASMHEIMARVLEQGPLIIPICAPTDVVMHSAAISGVTIPVNYDNDWTYVYYTEDE